MLNQAAINSYKRNKQGIISRQAQVKGKLRGIEEKVKAGGGLSRKQSVQRISHNGKIVLIDGSEAGLESHQSSLSPKYLAHRELLEYSDIQSTKHQYIKNSTNPSIGLLKSTTDQRESTLPSVSKKASYVKGSIIDYKRSDAIDNYLTQQTSTKKMKLLENVMREAHMIRNMPRAGGDAIGGYMSTLTSGRDSNNLLNASLMEKKDGGRKHANHGSYNYLPKYGKKNKKKINWKEQAQDSRRLMQPKRQTKSNVNLLKQQQLEMLEQSSMDILNMSQGAIVDVPYEFPAISSGKMSSIQKIQLHQSLESKPAQFLRDMEALREQPNSVIISKNQSLPHVDPGAARKLQYETPIAPSNKGKSRNSRMTSSNDTEKYHRDTFDQIDQEKTYPAPQIKRQQSEMQNLPHKRNQVDILGNLTLGQSGSKNEDSNQLYRSPGLRTNLDSSQVLGQIISKTQKLEEKALTFEKLKYSMKQSEDQLKSKVKNKKINLVAPEKGYQTNQEKRLKYEKGRLFREFQKNAKAQDIQRERKVVEEAHILETYDKKLKEILESADSHGIDHESESPMKVAFDAAIQEFEEKTGRAADNGTLHLENINRQVLEHDLKKKIDTMGSYEETEELEEDNFSNKLYSSGEGSPGGKPAKQRENYGSPIKRQGSIIEIYQEKYQLKHTRTRRPTPLRKRFQSVASASSVSAESPNRQTRMSTKEEVEEIDRMYTKIMDISNLSNIAGFDKQEMKKLLEFTSQNENNKRDAGSEGQPQPSSPNKLRGVEQYLLLRQEMKNQQPSSITSVKERRRLTQKKLTKLKNQAVQELLALQQQWIEQHKKPEERSKSPGGQAKKQILKHYSMYDKASILKKGKEEPLIKVQNQRNGQSPQKISDTNIVKQPSHYLTEEGKQEYLKKKQRKAERKKDAMFKRMLKIYVKPREYRDRYNMLSSYVASEEHEEMGSPVSPYQKRKQLGSFNNSKVKFHSGLKGAERSSAHPSTVVTTAQRSKQQTRDGDRPYEEKNIMKIIQTNSNASRSVISSRNTKSLQIASNNSFDQQDDKQEALMYNGADLPEAYLLAKLAFTKDFAAHYKQQQDNHKTKDEDRRNTQFHFNKADVFNETSCSFNQMLESEYQGEEPQDGLDRILSEFQLKMEFLKGIKQKNKNDTKLGSEAKGVHQAFALAAENYGNLSLPLLLKVKKGILYIPSLYRVSEGLAIAMRDNLRNLEVLNGQHISKAILQNNNMSDQLFANMLIGLRTRPEFISLISSRNEIGEQSIVQICNLLEGKNEKPELDYRTPTFLELKLMNSKCAPRFMDQLINSISLSQTLTRLSLKKMQLSERNQNQLIKFIKDNDNSRIKELDISWMKIPIHLIGNLFEALEKNTHIQNLNLGWIQMSGEIEQTNQRKHNDEILEKTFPKFCTFIKENSKLIHLNMTSVNLPEKYMLMLIMNLKRSQSLHCVHLCGNRMTPACIELIHSKLKPTFINDLIDEDKLEFKQAIVQKVKEDILKNYAAKYELIYDSVKNKDAMLEWMSVQNEYQHSQNHPERNDRFFMPLILNKQLGHPEIKNAKHWKISNECYQCDTWKYTMIFWDMKNTGKKFQVKDPVLEEMFEELIVQNDRFLDLREQGLVDNGKGQAYISGSFTNWEPRRMLQIDEMCAFLDQQNVHDPIQMLADPDRRARYNESIKDKWRGIIRHKAQYKDNAIQHVDFPDDDQYLNDEMPELDYNQLFVFADFIKPGKQQYFVTYSNTFEEPPPEPTPPSTKYNSQDENAEDNDWRKVKKVKAAKPKEEKEPFVPLQSDIRLTSYHQFLSTAHLGDYNLHIKVNEFDSVDRRFDKNKSVFKDWKVDVPKKIVEGFREEILHWKVPNFVKDQAEVQQIEDLMIQHSAFLKTLFIVHTSKSQFPVIGSLQDFEPIVLDWDLVDEGQFKLDAIQRIFISIVKNLPAELSTVLSAKNMSRFQFYEAIVRVAYFKFKVPGLTDTVYEGLQKVIDVITKKYDNSHPERKESLAELYYMWMGWRVDELWTLDIDDLYKANLKAMQKLYKYYNVAKKTKTYYLEDAIEMFTKDVTLNLLPEMVSQCWGMSKSTNYFDIKNRKAYYEAPFVEFLEFFARLGMRNFSHLPNATLQEKVEKLMDLSFPLVNAKRKEVVKVVEYVSCSEEELVEDKYFL